MRLSGHRFTTGAVLAGLLFLVGCAGGGGSAGGALPAAFAPLSVTRQVSAAGASWSPAVALGKTTGTGATLTTNSAGAAAVAFEYAPGQTSGTAAYSQIAAGQTWPKAVYGYAIYDASTPSIGIDGAGVGTLVMNGGQYDNYNTVVWSCTEPSVSVGFTSCRIIGGNLVMTAPAQFAAIDPPTGPIDVELLSFGCSLILEHPDGSYDAVSSPSECAAASRFALGPAGAGAAIYRTKTGLVRAALRNAAGAWLPPVTLAKAGTLPPVGLAASAASDGTTLLAWSLGKPGKPAQIWAAEVSAAGSVGIPVEVTAAACGLGIAAATLPDRTAVLAYPAAAAKGTCVPTLAAKAPGAAFAAPVAAAVKAHASAIVETATAGGNLAVAWQDGTAGADYAVTGTLAGFGAPVRIGALAPPQLASGGGYVNAAWCTNACYASTLALP